MITIRFDGLKEYNDMLTNTGRQAPYACMNAINDLAFQIRTAEIDTIKRTFPTAKPQTAKNIFVRKASKTNLQATIFFDQLYGKDGIDEYMLANILGGRRAMKPSEKRLGHYYVPGIGAKLDKYGNMQGGQITQILSRLGRFGDVAGYDMNQTAGSRRRRSGGSKATEYFMITKQRGGLKPGVYQRTEKRNGYTSIGSPRAVRGKTGAYQRSSSGMIAARGVVPVMLFVKKKPTYRAVWPFWKVGQNIMDTQAIPALRKAIDYAMRTAR